MDVEAAEFPDWEMLHSDPNSDSESLIPANGVVDEIGSDTGALIHVNYFSIDSQSGGFSAADGSDGGSVESDNPSWIDPGSENRFTVKNPGEFWSDSGSDRSEPRKSEVGFEGIEELSSEYGKNVMSDSVKFGDLEENVVSHLEEEKKGNEEVEGERRNEIIETEGQREAEAGEEKRRSIVWWKVPREILKYCAFRLSPVWTFSIAAALMGFVILGRRLYKMKRKAKGLELKLTVDDKKVSQFMSRAARLNEAFSVVKRVPVIRPQMPAVGVTPWPVMSLR